MTHLLHTTQIFFLSSTRAEQQKILGYQAFSPNNSFIIHDFLLSNYLSCIVCARVYIILSEILQSKLKSREKSAQITYRSAHGIL